MKATQRIDEGGQDLSLDRNINYEMKDKTITNSPTTSTLANKALRINVLGSRVLRYGLWL
jgi:hypothetical protein